MRLGSDRSGRGLVDDGLNASARLQLAVLLGVPRIALRMLLDRLGRALAAILPLSGDLLRGSDLPRVLAVP